MTPAMLSEANMKETASAIKRPIAGCEKILRINDRYSSQDTKLREPARLGRQHLFYSCNTLFCVCYVTRIKPVHKPSKYKMKIDSPWGVI